MSLRYIDDDLENDLNEISAIKNTSIATEIRLAIETHIVKFKAEENGNG